MKKTAILSIVLCLCMVLSLVMPGVSAFASANEAFPGADSSAEVAPGGDSEVAPGGDSEVAPGGDSEVAPGGDSDAAPGGDSEVAPGGDSEAAPGGDAETPDTPDTPAEKVTLHITSWEECTFETEKSKVAVDQDNLNAADWALIIYTSNYKGACITGNGWGCAIVVKDNKVVRVYDGTSGKYHDEVNPNGITGADCTSAGYAQEAFDSRKDGEIVIIAPNTGANNNQPGSRWYLTRYGKGIGSVVTLTGVTFPEPEKPTEPEQPDVPGNDNTGSLKVFITDNNAWADLATFTAPQDGTYTFTIAAGMGAYSKEDYDAWKPAYCDPNMGETNGCTFSVTLKKGETFEFYVMNPTKNVEVEIPWTAEFAGSSDSDAVTSGTIKVYITDNNAWADLATFTAPQDGTYTFTIAAGMGAYGKKDYDAWKPAYCDPNMGETNGCTFSVTLKKGETFEFYVMNPTKNVEVEIPWTAEFAGSSDSDAVTSGTIKVYITDNNAWADLATFTAPQDGTYTFTIAAGMGAYGKKDYDAWKPAYCDPNMGETNGCTFSVTLKKGETFEFYVMNPTKNVEVEIPWTCEPAGEQPKENIAVLGENSIVIENGTEGAEYTFVVDKAGDYTFASNDLMVQILNANGMMVGQGKAYLEPGTYTLKCGAIGGAVGTFQMNITVVYPKVTAQLGENFITVEEGTEGTEVEFVVDKAGSYTFAGDMKVTVYNADGMYMGMGIMNLEPGTYILRCAPVGGAAGTYKLKITTDAYDAPKVQIGENTITIENADNGIEATLEVTEAGYYQFSTTTEGVYVRVIVKDANGDQVFVNEGDLEAGTYTLTIVFTNDDAECQAGEFNLTVAAKVELQGDVIEKLPTTITGTSGDNLYYNYTATDDVIIDIIIVSGDPLITLNFDDIICEDLENGKRVTLKAGQSVIINPWNASMDFEIAVSIYDPETEIGGTQNPEALDNTKTELTLTGDANGYNFTWTAGKDGKVTFTLADTETLEGKQITVNGTALTLEAKTVTIDVTAGDVIAIVCTAEGTTVAMNVAFEEKTVEPDPTQPTTPPTTAPGTEPTQPTTGSGATEPNNNSTVIIVVIVIVVIAAAVVAVVIFKKKK